MGLEIERKWVTDVATITQALGALAEWPAGEELRQGYLAIDGDVTTRLRITPARAVLTIKAGGGLARTEVEVELDADSAEQLWAHTAGRRIAKHRHRLPLPADASADAATDSHITRDELVAEIDVYHGELDGLVSVEVEFADVTSAERFVAPGWFGTDVTGDPRWLNASLARHGRPAGPPPA